MWEETYPKLRSGLEGVLANAWAAGVRVAIVSVPQEGDAVNLNAVFTLAVIPFAELFGSDAENIERVFEEALSERESLLDGESIEVMHAQVSAASDAAQVAEVRRMRSADGGFMHGMTASLRTYIPFRGRFIVASGSSPQVELVPQLFALFAAIANSVEVSEE